MTVEFRILQRIHIKRQRELGRGTYEAKQIGTEVVVTATGATPTPNYKVWLALGPERIFPPIVELWWMRPLGPQLQVMTPFAVHLTFPVGEQKIERITVRDADGAHEVKVEQVAPPGPIPGGHKIPANSFRLMHGTIPISYATTSFIGEPIFSYGDQHFMGDDLQIVETPIGQQVTVVLETVPDLKVVTFTLVVPVVLLDGTQPTKIELPGVTATHHTTIAGPPLGQNTSYELAMLPGEAEYIVA